MGSLSQPKQCKHVPPHKESSHSQVTLSLAPGCLKSLWKVEQLQQEGLGVTHLPKHREAVRMLQRRLEMGVRSGTCIAHTLYPSPQLLPRVLPHLQQEGDRHLGACEELQGAPSHAKPTALFCCQKNEPVGTSRRKETGAQQCLPHLRQRANKREGGEQDLWL